MCGDESRLNASESKPLLSNGQIATVATFLAMTIVAIVFFTSMGEEPVVYEETTLDQRQMERAVDRLENAFDEYDFERRCLVQGFTFTNAFHLDGQHYCDIENELGKFRAVYDNELTDSEKLDKIIQNMESQK